MERLYRGKILSFNGSWNSGLALLSIENESGPHIVYCDNGATGRALIGAFDCRGAGHTIDNDKLQGQEIYCSLDETMPFDFLLAFTPVEEACAEMVEYYETQEVGG